MGQQPSKYHSPLTFGYVNHNDTPPPLPPKDGVDSSPSDRLPDYVLNHPELYKLELTCQCTMATTATKRKSKMDTNEEWIVATQNKECRTCRQNKRMSLVRNHLAQDLEYIDETYYSGCGSTAISTRPQNVLSWKRGAVYGNYYGMDTMDEDEEEDDHIHESWAKITVADATSQTSRSPVGSLERQGNVFTSLGARMTTGPSASFTLDLSERSLVKLSAGIGYLGNLTKLNLSNNQLSSLPKSIGYLKNLSVINASNNQLESVPSTIVYLTKLKAINISHNKITHLPPSLGSLPDLVVIIANNNRIDRVPRELAKLQRLVSFNISNNPLKQLPDELVKIKSLRKLITDGCDFYTEFVDELTHDPPSLFEQCARTIVRHQLALPEDLPDPIRTYLSTHQECTYCEGPYFESFVTRGRFVERVARQPIALESRLCCAHWSDNQDRLLNLFSAGSNNVSLTERNAGSSLSSIDTPTSNGSRKRSASNSSALSTFSYRRFPLLPPLPNLDSCSGTSLSSSSSSSSSSPLPTPPNRCRSNSSNSITKRFTSFLAHSKTNDTSRSSSSSLTQESGSVENRSSASLDRTDSLPQPQSFGYYKTDALPPLPRSSVEWMARQEYMHNNYFIHPPQQTPVAMA